MCWNRLCNWQIPCDSKFASTSGPWLRSACRYYTPFVPDSLHLDPELRNFCVIHHCIQPGDASATGLSLLAPDFIFYTALKVQSFLFCGLFRPWRKWIDPQLRNILYCWFQLVGYRVGIKKPTQKTHPKKPKKTHLKKPTKKFFWGVFLGFFKFFIFYENNTNFSLSNRFFMNK